MQFQGCDVLGESVTGVNAGVSAALAARSGLESWRPAVHDECCRVLEAAFSQDGFWQWQGQSVAWGVRYTVSFCVANGAVLLARDKQQAVASVMCLVAPGKKEDAESAAAVLAEVGLPPECGQQAEERGQEAGIAMRVLQDKACRGRRRWHLWMIGTRPDARGQGGAARLIGLCCGLGDRDKLPVYLETDSAAALYIRFGFESSSSASLSGYGHVLEGMLREPRARSSFPSNTELGMQRTVQQQLVLPLSDSEAMVLPLEARQWSKRSLPQAASVEEGDGDCGDDSLWLADLFAFGDEEDALSRVYRLSEGPLRTELLPLGSTKESFLAFTGLLCGNTRAALLQPTGVWAPVVGGAFPVGRKAMRAALLLTAPLTSTSLLFRAEQEGCVTVAESEGRLTVTAAGREAALIARHYARFLAGLPLVESALVAKWNSAAWLCTELLPEALLASFRRNSHLAAVRDGETVLSYGELERRVASLMTLLPAAGTVVAIVCHSSAAYVTAVCACLFAACSYVPVDPTYPTSRIQHILRDSEAALVLSQSSVVLQCGERVNVDALVVAAEAAVKLRTVAASDVAYLIYTSGSTGSPKGVVVEHRGLLSMLQNVQSMAQIRQSDVGLHFYGVAFDGSVVNVFLMLLAGGSLVTRGSEGWLQLLAETTVGFLTPSVLSVLEHRHMAHLRLIVVGGEALPPAAVARSPCPLLNIYGPTEVTVVSSAALLTRDSPIVHAGRPFANLRYWIVDNATQKELPVGCVGELVIGGIGVARGYKNLLRKTSECFVEDESGARRYRSGDLARWLDDGSVQVLGRATSGQVKVAGYRIELREVESAIERLPGVCLVTVLLCGDSLAAFVAPKNASVDRAALALVLPAYMIPSRVELLEDLPRTHNGKVDTAALLSLLSSSSMSSSSTPSSTSVASLAIVQRFALLCCAALGGGSVPGPDEVLRGLNSISAVRLVATAQRELSLALSLESLLRGQKTLRAIVSEAASSSVASCALTAVSRQRDTFPLSRNQERLMALHLMDPTSCSYNVPLFYRFENASCASLAALVRRLFARHEVFRLVFCKSALLQSIAALAPPVRELREGCDLALLQREEMEKPFDLFVACARASVVPLSATSAALLLCCHHIAVDGLSAVTVLRELSALLQGQELSPLPLQFVDYAFAEHTFLTQERIAGWLSQYEPLLRVLPIVAVLPPSKVPIRSQWLQEKVSFNVSGLPQFTPNVICFALFVASLHRCGIASVPDVVAGTVSQNRQLFDGPEDVVGFFVNTVPLRVAFADCTFGELFRRCQEACLGAMLRQACPFDAVAEAFHLQLDVFFSLVDFVPRVPGVQPIAQPAVCKFGLELEVELLAGGTEAVVTWLYDTNRISTERVQQLAAHFVSLLSSVNPALLSAAVSDSGGALRHGHVARLAFETELDADTLAARAQRLFRATPLLCDKRTEFVLLHGDAADSPALDGPVYFHLTVLETDGGRCVVSMAATCCDRPSLELFARHLLASDGDAECFAHIGTGALPCCDSAAGLAFWSARLADTPVFADLPCDRVRTQVLAEECGCFCGPLAAAVDDVLLSVVVGLVVGQHCVRQAAILVGHVVNLRSRDHDDGSTVGPLTNVVPLRIDCGGDALFGAVLGDARATLAQAPLALPFAAVAAALDPDSGTGRTRLVQVTAAVRSGSLGAAIKGELGHGPLYFAEISVELDGSGCLRWFYRSDLWDAETMATLHGHIVALLANAAPDKAVKDISLISASEMTLLADGFLQAGPPPSAAQMHEPSLRHCAAAPDAPAVWEAGKTVSFGALLAMAESVVVPAGGAPVAVLLARSAQCIAAQLSILLQGCPFVPLDPAYPAARIAFILKDANVSALLIHAATRHLVPPEYPKEKIIDLDDVKREQKAVRVDRGRDATCYIMYTSGTTGDPKGVVVRHCGVVNYVESWAALTGCSSSDKSLWFAGVAFDASIENVWGTLSSGGCVVVRTDMWLSELAHCTMLDCTPSALAAIDIDSVPQLRLVSSGAEELLRSLRNEWRCRKRLVNLYGPTEVTIAVTGAEMSPSEHERSAVTIGRPLHNMRVFVVRPGTTQMCGLGVPGELCFAGVQVAAGYHNRPDLTRDKFLPCPFSSGEMMYRTGDLARLACDGRVFFLGRQDGQTKLRGFRVELAAVESVLLSAPNVRDVTALVANAGTPQALLAAWVVPENVSIEDVRRHCAATLPPYMVPDAIVPCSALPKTANGKIDKKALVLPAAPAAPQAPEGEAETLSAMEKDMLSVFSRMVGGKVSKHSRFFESGLNSISAMKLAFALKHYGVEITDILRQQTVARLARFCAERTSAGRGELAVRLSSAARPSAAARCVVVLVHGPAGTLGQLRGLGERIRKTKPGCVVLGVHLAAGAGVASVPQLAAEYVAAVKKLAGGAGAGWVLAGEDVTGALAVEMTRQMRRAGEEVAKLVLLGRPFLDERAYLKPPSGLCEDAAAAGVWTVLSRLCLAYAKQPSVVLPVSTVLFVPSDYHVEGMDEVLQQTLCDPCRCIALAGGASWQTVAAVVAEELLEQPQSAGMDMSMSSSAVVVMRSTAELLMLQSRSLRASAAPRQPHQVAVPRPQRLLLSQSQQLAASNGGGLRASSLAVSQLRLEKSVLTNALWEEMHRDAAMPLPFLANLSEDSTAAFPDRLSRQSTGCVLLTGATGFIGRVLLDTLLTDYPLLKRVYCVVRGAAERVAASDRVAVLQGNLALPRLGLGEKEWSELESSVDYVIHNGAFVNHVMEYQQMRDTNVLGVVEVLRLCCHPARPKLLVVVSTTGVVPVLPGETPQSPARESTSLVQASDQETGYCQTKHVAEQLCVRARAAGLSVTLARPALIGWSRAHGVPNPSDWLTGLVAASLLVNAVPQTGHTLTLMPVDECARGIILPLVSPKSEAVIHLSHTAGVPYRRLYAALRRASPPERQLPAVSFADWLVLVKRALNASPQHSALLAPSLLILASLGDLPGDRVYDTARAEALGVPRSPPLDDAYFDSMARHMVATLKL